MNIDEFESFQQRMNALATAFMVDVTNQAAAATRALNAFAADLAVAAADAAQEYQTKSPPCHIIATILRRCDL